MNNKRLIAAALLCIMTLTACAQSRESTSDVTSAASETAEETTVNENPEPALPDYNGEGEDFEFLLRLTDYAYDEIYVYTEGYDGEVVNDAIFDRNRAVEEKLNIKIAATYDAGVAGVAQKAIMANDEAFEALWECKNSMTTLATSGYLVNFNTLPYVQLDASYWDANAVEQLSVLNKLFFMPSDISMENLNGVRFLYFNKKLINDYTLSDPYDLLHSNGWTLDVVLGMIKAVSADLNGDGVMDGNDQFGILAEGGDANSNIQYFLKSAGIRNTINNSDGIPELSFNTEKTVKIMEMCREVLSDPKVAITYEQASKGMNIGDYPHYFAYCRGALFTTDHFLFCQGSVNVTETFKDMVADYGVAPNPKYDSEQESYYHRNDPFSDMMAIPITNSDLERTGIILEYMSWKSSETVKPAYYETTIKTKRIRDDESPAIIDMIKGTISYEISEIFGLGVTSVIWNGYNSGNFASTYAKQEKAMQKNLDKMVASFEQIN